MTVTCAAGETFAALDASKCHFTLIFEDGCTMAWLRVTSSPAHPCVEVTNHVFHVLTMSLLTVTHVTAHLTLHGHRI